GWIGETGETPATISARCTEPGNLLLDHHNLQRRISLEQVIGGPKAGEARAHNGNVNNNRSIQRGPWCQITGILQPEAVLSVVFHCVPTRYSSAPQLGEVIPVL